MSQIDLETIDPSTTDGNGLASSLNSWHDTLHSSHKGPAAPSYAQAGMLWVDDLADPVWVLKLHDGSGWTSLFTIDTANDKTQLGSWSEKESTVSVKSANYTTVASDNGALLNVDATSSNLTITLLAAATASNGHFLIIKKSDSTTNTVTIDANSTETIDGATTLVLANENDTVLLMSDGSNWQILAQKSPSSGAASGFSGMPEGIPIAWVTNTVPTHTLAMNGQNVSRATYSKLFTAIGVTYGSGDGSTTFTLPDWRGEFIRGWDNTAGNDPDAASRTDRGDATTGDNVGTKQVDEYKSHTHDDAPINSLSVLNTSGTSLRGHLGTTRNQPLIPASGGNETRPRNVYVNWIITTGGQ